VPWKYALTSLQPVILNREVLAILQRKPFGRNRRLGYVNERWSNLAASGELSVFPDSMSINPYSPPSSDVQLPEPECSREETIRKSHYTYEQCLLIIPGVYFFSLFLSMVMLASLENVNSTDRGLFLALAAGVGLPGFGVLMYGIGTFQNRARKVCLAISAAALFAYPVGTSLHLIVLGILCHPKARVVFGPDYRGIVARTSSLTRRKKKRVTPLEVIVVIMIIAILACNLFPIADGGARKRSHARKPLPAASQ
jgi:hypothetical protein